MFRACTSSLASPRIILWDVIRRACGCRLPKPDFGAGLNFIGVDGIPREVPASETGLDWLIDSRWRTNISCVVVQHEATCLLASVVLSSCLFPPCSLHQTLGSAAGCVADNVMLVCRDTGSRPRCVLRTCSSPCGCPGHSGSVCRPSHLVMRRLQHQLLEGPSDAVLTRMAPQKRDICTLREAARLLAEGSVVSADMRHPGG